MPTLQTQFSEILSHYPGNLSPDFSKEDTDILLSYLTESSTIMTVEQLEEINAIYWLTHGLACAVDSRTDEQIERACATFLSLSDKEPAKLAIALAKPIRDGKYKGQSLAAVLMYKLSAAAFYEHNQAIIDNITIFFTNLFNKAPAECVPMLMQRIDEGAHAGGSPLFALVYALGRAANLSDNQEAAFYICALLNKCLQLAPHELSDMIIQKIALGPYADKSIYYFLVAALKQAIAHKNFSTARELASVLKDVAKNVISHDDFLKSLTDSVVVQPHQLMAPVYVLLLALEEAAFIRETSDTIAAIASIFLELIDAYPYPMGEALTHTTAVKEFAEAADAREENGIFRLVNANSAALSHHNDIRPIVDVLKKLVEKAVELMGPALTKVIPYAGDAANTPWSMLIKAYKETVPSSSQLILKALFSKLLLSSIGSQLSDVTPSADKVLLESLIEVPASGAGGSRYSHFVTPPAEIATAVGAATCTSSALK